MNWLLQSYPGERNRMPAQACVNHPNEQTYVRCGRCDQPFCVRCLVDTPVGKKCRPCAENRTHLQEWTPRQVLLAFLAATAVAVPCGWIAQEVPIPILAFPFGFVVGEVALRAGRRSRSVPVQVVTGVAALIGGVVGAIFAPREFWSMEPELMAALVPHRTYEMVIYPIIVTVIGIVLAVFRVRYL